MGAWGVKLYDDDVAQDVKEEYIELLKQGIENEEVTKQMIDKWDTEDEEDGPVFWFALADIQWKYGRLLENVKEKALYHIKTGTDLERWKEDKTLYNKRKKVLEELEEKLNSPMPKLKRIVKFKPYICQWNIGDVYAYQIKDDEAYKGKYIVLIKIEEKDYLHNICPIVYVYNKLFDEIPTVEELENVEYMQHDIWPCLYYNGTYKDNLFYKCLIYIENSTKKFTNDYVYIGNMKNYPLPSNEALKGDAFKLIQRFEECIVDNYSMWKVAEICLKKTGGVKKWGVKIEHDDTAQNVQEEYEDLLKYGVNNEEATKQMIEKWDIEDIEEGPIFWYALASIQWEYGRLLENVKEQALHHIKTGTDLESWKEDKAIYSKRKEVLRELEEKLNSPMRRPVKLNIYYKCTWNIGDVYAYKIKKDKENKGKYIVIIKIGEENYAHDICPIVYIYNKLFDKLPAIEELNNVKYMPILPFSSTPEDVYNGKYENVGYKELIEIDDSSRKHVKKYIHIGNIKNYPVPSNETSNKKSNNLCRIVEFEEETIENYNKWKGIDYSN